MTAHVELMSMPIDDENAVVECSECGALGITLTSEAKGLLLRHLATEHIHNQGAPT